MFRKSIQPVLAIIMIVSFMLAGCAPVATPAPATEAPVVATEAPVVATEAPAVATEAPAVATEAPAPTEAPAAEPVEITYMRQSDNPDIELDYIKEFEAQNPNIKVKVDSVPANDNYNKLVLTTNAGNPPDVFMSFWTASAVSNKLIYPLTEFVDPAQFEKRFTTAGQSYAKYQDVIYAIPWRAGASVFLVNCKMFKEAGIEIPKLGWTWKDLADISAKLTNKEKGTYGYGLVGSSTDYATEWQFWPYLLQAGGKIIDGNKAVFNSPAGVKALEFLISLQPSMPEGFTSMDLNQMVDLMVSDKVAMFEDGPWFIGIIQSGHPDFEVCVAPMTVGDVPGNITGGTALGMSPLSKHKAEAWKFIDFMTSDDILIRWNEATNNMPPNVAALERPMYKEGPLSVAAQAVVQPGVIPANQYPESDALNAIMRTYLQAAYLGQMTPQEALDKAAEEWNAILAKY
jgi:multiple sugar transport system substrate-binding protein